MDGEEDILTGLDLYEFSEVLVEFGAWQALVSFQWCGLQYILLLLLLLQNLDGGGSSVSVFRGHVISKPTCIDIHVICERSVSSIACMKE